jgi:hypothetical protein
MTTINSIGFLLVDNINSKTDINKVKLMGSINSYKNELEKKQKKEKDKKNKYYNEYESKRINNNEKYNKYMKDNKTLFDKWRKSKKSNDLYNYLTLKKPDIEEVEDIYTAMI